MMPHRRRPARRPRGLSLVELMVGLGAGLAVLAGATVLAGAQLAEQRRLLLEARLQQDLRAAADVAVRDLRRAGTWLRADAGLRQPDAPLQPNPHAAVQPATAAQSWVRHAWDRGTDGPPAQGLRLEGGVLQTLVGSAWQALTDPQALRVTAFVVTPSSRPGPALPCTRDCPDGSQDCWPRLRLRMLTIEIAGHPPEEPALLRRVATLVRLRNDVVEGECP